MRTFESGATRDTDAGKPDYSGFLSPSVVRAFGEYMLRHQTQADGSLRESDNWKKGMPKAAYMSSGFRHFVDWWDAHERDAPSEEKVDALCALLFNVQGYLYEEIKGAATIEMTAEGEKQSERQLYIVTGDPAMPFRRVQQDILDAPLPVDAVGPGDRVQSKETGRFGSVAPSQLGGQPSHLCCVEWDDGIHSCRVPVADLLRA